MWVICLKHLPLIPYTFPPNFSPNACPFLLSLTTTLLPFLYILSSATLFLPFPLCFQNQHVVCFVKILTASYSVFLLVIYWYKVSFTLTHKYSYLAKTFLYIFPSSLYHNHQIHSFNLQKADSASFVTQTNALKGIQM